MTVRFGGYAIAGPLLDLLHASGDIEARVLGSSSTSAYLLAGDFVVAITARTVPLMPNSVAVIQGHALDAFEPAATAKVTRGHVVCGRAVVTLSHAQRVDLVTPCNSGHGAAAVARRGTDLLAAMGFQPASDPIDALSAARPELVAGDGLGGLSLLHGALERSDVAQAVTAARALAGRGPGLTPDGDDLLAATCAALFAFAPPAGLSSDVSRSLSAALLLPDLATRTGALPATLLRLAASGQVIDPVRKLLDLDAGSSEWKRALGRLQRIGHGTGWTYALGCALAARALTQRLSVTKDRPTTEGTLHEGA